MIDLEHDGRVAVITLNRPEQRNALSAAMCDALAAALDETGEARAILLRGAGGVFCSGADFAAVSGPGGIDFLPSFEGMLAKLAAHRLPTVAAIHGAALGGGLQLATACDFRVCASDATLGIPSSRLGIVVNYDNVRRLVLLAGVARAKEILMAARTFTASEAKEAGLVTELAAPEDVQTAAAAFAAQLAGLAPLGVQGSKQIVDAVAAHMSDVRSSAPETVAELDRLVEDAYRSRDLQEGLAAMKERRPPEFEGR
ncbi:MAG TPA: enoyl-CoA hydratase/isomerase family protein [Actinomycetota bacterium]|nr:enoyl-CoA hydratase/isomerase family protein [Actinomycetota bacterium]